MNSTQCSLFTVLPLPVRTTQPVHIHALFSLTPDRANLHRMHDQSAQNQDPAKWNEWLLREGASVGWVKLLSALAQLYPLQSAFDQWPRAVDNNRDPLSGAVDRIVAIIQQDHLALWPTEIGYVSAETGLLALGSESPGLKEALRDANVPVTYVPRQLWDHAKKLFGSQLLSSANVCAYLNSKAAVVRGLRDRVKIALLEFLVSAPAVIDHGRLELFPFEDGEFRSLDGVNAFVHRDSAEKDLFSRQPELNLALGRLPEQTQIIFVDGCESRTLHPSIRFRSVDSFRDYCSRTFFAGFDQALEAHALDTDGAGFVTSAWSWILDRKISIKDENLSALWLLPMSDGQYRQLRYKQTVIYLAPPGLSGDILRRMDAELLASSRPLLLTGKASLGRRSSAVVTNLLQAKCIGVLDALNLLVYVQWLLWAMPLATTTGDQERDNIVESIFNRLTEQMNVQDLTAVKACIRGLPIFKKLMWESKGLKMNPLHAWTTLNRWKRSIGILDQNTKFPEIHDLQFLVATSGSHQQGILDAWKLADCVQPADVIQGYIIPAWQNGLSDNWGDSCKENIAAYMLGMFFFVGSRQLGSAPKFANRSDLIDSDVTELSALCFEDEEVVPKENFLRNFNIALKDCGMKTSIDEAVVRHRIKCYASGNYPLVDVQVRAKLLLRSSCKWQSVKEADDSELRCLAWLPVTQAGFASLKDSSQCRGFRDRSLVGSQLPILKTPISEEWESRLGWNATIATSILMAQLQHGIPQNSRMVVDAVLSYIDAHRLLDELAPELKILRCVAVSSGLFVEPAHAFCPSQNFRRGCYLLEPYLANVDSSVWRYNEKLLRQLGVRDKPEPADLLRVQEILGAKDKLEERDVGVAIELLNFAAKFSRNSLLGLKILGASGRFRNIEDICYNDSAALHSRHNSNLTQPKIPLPRS
ncbi:uncharacterized protein RSE6_11382 [Rhynchosporium secalis]|uniref:Uncharacterized protein n=1 Tax=Rhynchosporium secalis TaxID=38038 RepID=A0A1E1MMV2_RHYSE|nr:uncharacterized protein RSE6_11382 [Rhynchosporium secalis]